MAEKKKRTPSKARKTPEAFESYLINLAMKRAAEMLENGNAPAQIVSHFLKLGTEKAKYEREKIKADAQLAISKANLIETQRRSEETAAKALEAFKRYAGFSEETYDEDEDYYDDEY